MDYRYKAVGWWVVLVVVEWQRTPGTSTTFRGGFRGSTSLLLITDLVLVEMDFLLPHTYYSSGEFGANIYREEDYTI